MTLEQDNFYKAFDGRFDSDFMERRARQLERLLILFRDTGMVSTIRNRLLTKVVAEGEALKLETSIGEVEVKFVPYLDGDQLGWTAIFQDFDESGEARDLYAIKLGERPFVDSTGEPLPFDEFMRQHTDLAAFAIVRRVLAEKLRMSDERVQRQFD